MAKVKRKATPAVTARGQEYQLVPIESIEPHPQNVNQGDIGSIFESVKVNGFIGAAVVQRSTRRILAGKHRWLAAKQAGIASFPVLWVDVDDATAIRYMLADNRTARLGADDPEALADLLQSIRADQGSLLGTGFDDAALQELLEDIGKPFVDDSAPDEVPEIPVTPVSKLGDLWLLGPHRVLCGDSTAKDAVSRACGADAGLPVPFLMVTDPPYGVEYDPEWREKYDNFKRHATGKVSNDDRVDWAPAYELFPGGVAYVWHAGVYAGEVAVGLATSKFEIRAQIIWKKQHFVFGRGSYHWGHEPCWYAVRRGKQSNWHGDRKQSTGWEVQNLNPMGGNKDEKATGHGTQKPVELMRRPIQNHTVTGDAVYDPFLGSGTTLIAAEQLGRVCYGIDIDPKYVDVIVTRWQDFTGKEAIHEETGATFAHVKEGRRLGGEDAIKEEVLEAVA